MEWGKLMPPFQQVRLPSNGKFYKSKSFKDGWVEIREYAAPEESLIASINKDNIQRTVNSILENCIKGDDVEIGELTSEDAFYLLVWLRANSYSSDYETEISCPHCKISYPYTINLGELTIVYLEDDVDLPIEVFLPKTKLTVYVDVIRRSTEVRAVNRLPEIRRYAGLEGDPINLLRRAYSIVKVVTSDSKEISNILEIEDLCLRYLPSSDSLVIDSVLDGFKHGVDSILTLECSGCKEEIKTILPPTAEFFRPRRIKQRDPRATDRRDSELKQTRGRQSVSEDSVSKDKKNDDKETQYDD